MDKVSALEYETPSGIIRLHVLKTVQPFFDAVDTGEKSLELRKFDRDYQVGDYLALFEYSPSSNNIGKRLVRKVTHLMTNVDHDAVSEGYIAMSIRPLLPDEVDNLRVVPEFHSIQ